MRYNELARDTVQQLGRNLKPYTRYFGDSGQRVYEHRRRNSHCPMKLAKAKKFVSFAVKQILTKHLAPDTICGLAREKVVSSRWFAARHFITILSVDC